MPSRRYKSPLHRVLRKVVESPFSVLEGLQFVLLAWLLVAALLGFGGFLPYGEQMVGVSAVLLLLTVVHALAALLLKEPPGGGWELLLPVPFLAYAALNCWGWSPAPWAGSLYLVALVQAYAVFLVSFNRLRSSLSGLTLLGLCMGVVLLSLAGALFQFYQFPEWIITLERDRFDGYLQGAAGFLMDPQTLAPVLLLFWPVTVTGAWLRRFSGPLRILSGALALFLPLGILMSANPWGVLLFFLTFLSMPLVLEQSWRYRLKLWLYGTLGLLAGLAFFWYRTQELRERLEYLLEQGSRFMEAGLLQVAWRAFLDAPLFGIGVGGFPVVLETIRDATLQQSSTYPPSTLLGYLAAFGLVGLLLVLLPLVLLGHRTVRTWAGLPYLAIEQDIARRLRHLSPRQRARSQLGKIHGRSSSSKIVVGGLIPGIGAFLLSQVLDYSLYLPFHLFMLAVAVALLCQFRRRFQTALPPPRVRLALALVPVVLSTWAAAYGVPRFYAQHLVYTMEEDLRYLSADPDRIFMDPGALRVVEELLEDATALHPGNARAWTLLAEARMAWLHAELYPLETVAAWARPALEQAARLEDPSWRVPFHQARVELLSGGGLPVAREHLREAIARAPYRAEPRTLLGILLLIEDPDAAEGRDFLRTARILNPDYPPVRQLQSWFDLATDSGSRTGDAASRLTPAQAAETCLAFPDLPDRIRGAGVPVRDP